MSSLTVSDSEIIEELKSLESDKKRELLDYIHFLKGKKSGTRKIDWNDITGIAEFDGDSSINHDKCIQKIFR